MTTGSCQAIRRPFRKRSRTEISETLRFRLTVRRAKTPGQTRHICGERLEAYISATFARPLSLEQEDSGRVCNSGIDAFRKAIETDPNLRSGARGARGRTTTLANYNSWPLLPRARGVDESEISR